MQELIDEDDPNLDLAGNSMTDKIVAVSIHNAVPGIFRLSGDRIVNFSSTK